MKIASALAASASLLMLPALAHAEAPKVVVSIKPIHSLVAAVMQGIGEPSLIVEGSASPHTYAMKPSNAAALQEADLVFWVGPGLEAFLDRPLETLGGKAKVIELEDAPGVETLPLREGGAFEAHDDDEHGEEGHGAEAHASHEAEGTDVHAAHEDEAHEQHASEGHGDDEHGHGEIDMHLWLAPENARAMATEIAHALEEADPQNAKAYRANLVALEKRIDALDGEIRSLVEPVKSKPFVVFHDAYQYFERHYGVRVAGSITVSPETLPGAERLSQIRAKVTELGATCVFAEPQFEPKLVNVVIEGTPAKSGTLDPEGGALAAGPDLYFDLMKSIGTSLRDCLTSGS
ncbi:zinc ABC transporter substrate-binding protein ZnuA [Rhizobium sp. TRM95111]|uniref:zinc ABC transporter substrate-binding protein ZnuA n=1 Tax=Rhizobium alarense TaxID=2846851 RepID=UPI001F4503DA|nr:zinc ABC transporter substrate-binding protein ZnuA [Rhizobium alarense]MCF3640083.1 zinc ABC transporter substrate-binding protein ZnuA [Rhizobium alarense]